MPQKTKNQNFKQTLNNQKKMAKISQNTIHSYVYTYEMSVL